MADPIWIIEAKRFLGTRPFNKNKNRCALFVGGVLEKSGLPSTQSIKARSYLTYGQELLGPARGCIVVLWRKDLLSDLGHIGFYMQRTSNGKALLLDCFEGLVWYSSYPFSRVIGYRWPHESLRRNLIRPPSGGEIHQLDPQGQA